MIDFDTVIDRRNTCSVKYDLAVERGKPADVLPLWVADMEFKAPECVSEAIKKSAEHGIFGYSRPDEKFYTALQSWMKEQHDFVVKKEWCVNTPGIVFAINVAIRAFTKEGDGVLIQPPVYYPFKNSILANNRTPVLSPLVLDDGVYKMNFQDFEEKIEKNHPKLFILCSPHNPVGRVWTKEELKKINEICLRHNVIVFSDEIHSDFVISGNQHTVFQNLGNEACNNSIVATSASKSFNLAGLQFSTCFIQNENLRNQFKKELERSGYDEPNLIGIVATTAAYQGGKQWLDEVKKYIAGNTEFLRNFIKEHMPKAKLIEPQGTYLLWIDFSGYGYTDNELDDIIVNKAKVWLDRGTMFGQEGNCFQRINVTCARSVLKEALEAMAAALEQ